VQSSVTLNAVVGGAVVTLRYERWAVSTSCLACDAVHGNAVLSFVSGDPTFRLFTKPSSGTNKAKRRGEERRGATKRMQRGE